MKISPFYENLHIPFSFQSMLPHACMCFSKKKIINNRYHYILNKSKIMLFCLFTIFLPPTHTHMFSNDYTPIIQWKLKWNWVLNKVNQTHLIFSLTQPSLGKNSYDPNPNYFSLMISFDYRSRLKPKLKLFYRSIIVQKPNLNYFLF